MTAGRYVYRCAEGVTWVRDAAQIFVVDATGELSCSLHGAAAAVWDFLALGYPYEKIVHFLSLLLGLAADEARAELISMLCGWQDAGIVQVVG